jgi:predicted RNA-binding protein associated with RNAse of E/G family
VNVAFRDNTVVTPQTQADVQDLADKLNRGEITADEYFAAVERRAQRMFEEATARA